tara:strand:- start:121 stop:426 length:306 start_codon:yes stop_codon:yes gene_type:complete
VQKQILAKIMKKSTLKNLIKEILQEQLQGAAVVPNAFPASEGKVAIVCPDGYNFKNENFQTLGPVGPATQIVHIVEGCIPNKKTFTDKFGSTVSPIGAGPG